ncbi:MAG TPA: hypothetical protein VE077_10235 [Candidatus Methylomirabilis sp.]|nr:hypothetical protein [Candidatus Methylomirabilis sp.]
MASKPVSMTNKKTYWGSALIVAGLLALLANLAPAAASSARFVASFKTGLTGLVSSVGLSFLHAVGAVALGQVDYATVFARILVLFSAMVAIILGIALMRSRSSSNGERTQSSSATPNDQEAQ